MRQYKISRTLFDCEIIVQILCPDQGIHVSIFGGELSHIGAVSIVDPDGNLSTTQFAGHKDAAVSEAWAKAMAQAGFRPLVVEAGIHYDHLSPEGIQQVLTVNQELLAEALAWLKKGNHFQVPVFE
jgi:hypothetical protein